MKSIGTMVSLLIVGAAMGLILPSIDSTAAAEPSFTYTMPEGWKTGSAPGAVATATSPDNTVLVMIMEFANKKNLDALQIAQNQLKKIKYISVINPPTDVSKMKDRFSADSVAKVQLARERDDGIQVSYRAFIFVKKGTFVVIEAYATKEASEKVFNQANSVIENFRFK